MNKSKIKIAIIFLVILLGIISFKVIFPKNDYLLSKTKDVISVSFQYRLERTKQVKVNEFKLYLIENKIAYDLDGDTFNIKFENFKKESLMEKIKEINYIPEIISLPVGNNLSFNIQDNQDKVNVYFENTNILFIIEFLLKNGIDYHQKDSQTFTLNKNDLNKVIEGLEDLGMCYYSFFGIVIINSIFLMLCGIIGYLFFIFILKAKGDR